MGGLEWSFKSHNAAVSAHCSIITPGLVIAETTSFPSLYHPFGNCYVAFLKHKNNLLLSQWTITVFQGPWKPDSTHNTELTASWIPAMLEGFQISSRKPTSHHIGGSIFLWAKVTSVFFNCKTLGYQSPDSRSLSSGTKVLSLLETRLKPTRAKPQSVSSAKIVCPHHTGRPSELTAILLSQKKDCQIFLDALNPDKDFSGPGKKGFP